MNIICSNFGDSLIEYRGNISTTNNAINCVFMDEQKGKEWTGSHQRDEQQTRTNFSVQEMQMHAHTGQQAAEHQGETRQNNDTNNSRLTGTFSSTQPNAGAMMLPAPSTFPVPSSLSLAMASGVTGRLLPFPYRLHHMLEDAEKHGKQDIVSWMPFGRSFKVHKPDRFVKEVASIYFNLKQYKSFKRQLHNYGFTKIESGHAAGSFYHPFFIRDDPNQCHLIIRYKNANKDQDSGKITAPLTAAAVAAQQQATAANQAQTGTSSITSASTGATTSQGSEMDMFAAFMGSSGSTHWPNAPGDLRAFPWPGRSSSDNEGNISPSRLQARLNVSTSLTDFQAILDHRSPPVQAFDEEAKMPARRDSALGPLSLSLPRQALGDDHPSTTGMRPSHGGMTSTPPSNVTNVGTQSKEQQLITMMTQSAHPSTISWLLGGATSLSELANVMEGYLPGNQRSSGGGARRRNVHGGRGDDPLFTISMECTEGSNTTGGGAAARQINDDIVSLFESEQQRGNGNGENDGSNNNDITEV